MARSLLDILVSRGVIDLNEAAQARLDAQDKSISIDDVLYARGIQEGDVADAKAELTGFPVKYLQGASVELEALHDIPEESARHYSVIPLGKSEGYFDAGMLFPEDVSAREAVKFIASRINLPLRMFIVTPSDFQNVLMQYKNLTGEVTKALGEFEKEYESLGDIVGKGKGSETKIVEDAPVTKIVAVILRHAVEGRASDIHIEPGRDQLRIRFRVDGILHINLTLPQGVHAALVSRIKVMTNLKIDETRVPQDGRFHAKILDREIDFRVSTFPTSFGEKVVIRILDPSSGISNLEDLGITGRNKTAIEEAIKAPFGMILITGPTGSGKSTTLYALLQMLNEEGVNIVSLEDPIEYYVNGVNQSQVRPEINYDFATGLRHILRQDPDIIMVGEIRDKETATLAVHAALTGHLVLSTLHTNNATGVIPRLIDMGVDPYLIPSTVVLMMAQRLTRRLCPDSRKKVKLTGKIKDTIIKEISEIPGEEGEAARKNIPSEIYQAEVSSACPKGTRGRIGIYEMYSMTPELEKIILAGATENKLLEEAQRQGMITMRQDGALKVLKGIMGMEELLEVV
ncbi:MAG: Flp pilus assembly complex ATPase component TadA [Candidatus Sungbacteria bacterium]|nr:Flp pilus assembly complex ATPase component TadA [Candidatus Sungbacteria bacterium]